ncbi:MAG: dipeptide epimerase [Ferruginibacter sp.]|nr:dipeptide epimerase [Ferruginibacter sp.]
MKVFWKAFDLPFEYPFTISKGTKSTQPTLAVALQHLGINGFGEAPAISYYGITTEKMISDLQRKKLFVEKFSFTEPDRYWHYLHHLLEDNSFLVCALDMAGWDIYGKMQGKPLYDLWELDTDKSPVTDYTIGWDEPEVMVKKLKEHPWPAYKIKVGLPDDIERVQELRLHTKAPFRVDANGGWTFDEAVEKINQLKNLDVELVEQPLHQDDWEGAKKLYKVSALPLFADESCVEEEDVLRCKGAFHGINIKLTKCSGITPAKRMIANAHQMDLKVMLGCMNESSIGTAAIAHLAPMADYLDVDGPLLLTEDLARGHEIVDGYFEYNERPGLGLQLFHNFLV